MYVVYNYMIVEIGVFYFRKKEIDNIAKTSGSAW